METAGVSVKVWLNKLGRLKINYFAQFVFDAFENFFDLPRKAVGFVDALNLGVAETRAATPRQAGRSRKPFVVHFHHENVV